MEVILAYVSSADGFLTDSASRQPNEWASAEDQRHFQELSTASGVVIIGSNTYDAHKRMLKPSPDIKRIVMTRDPEKYAANQVMGKLEFTSDSPQEVIAKLQAHEYKHVLLAGGPKLYQQFFAAHLITDLEITIEPLLFGAGVSAATGIPSNIKLKLVDSYLLNNAGTLLVKYKVLY